MRWCPVSGLRTLRKRPELRPSLGALFLASKEIDDTGVDDVAGRDFIKQIGPENGSSNIVDLTPILHRLQQNRKETF
jgi:hypothetical protein